MSIQAWTLLFVVATFGLYLAVAWVARVRDTRGFYVAGRGVPAAANGMATAADWMSAASFISMAGLISFSGFTGAQYLMGWTGGYVLLALLLAPYLRKFGRFTVPAFIGDRFDSDTARIVAVICALFVSFTYVAGQMRGVGIVFSRFLEVDVTTGVLIGMAIVFVYATLGGMKGITWTQVCQYWVLITAFLIPAIAISLKLTGNPIPQLGIGDALASGPDAGTPLLTKLNQITTDLGFGNYTDAPAFSDPGGAWINPSLLNMFCVTVALMVGTAGLPHVIVRFYTVKNVRAARWSGFWALLFISLLYLTAPATAIFARVYMTQSLNQATTETLPAWYTAWEGSGLVQWFDDGDGRVRYEKGPGNEIFNRGKLGDWDTLKTEHAAWLASGGAEGRDVRSHLIGLGDGKIMGPDRDIIVLAAPEMAELTDWIIAFVAAGGLAAALSTASGLLIVISSSVAHDVYFRILRPESTEAQRLRVGRIAIAAAVLVAGYFGINPPGFVSQVVAFAFGLAASSFFPALVLGIFSRRVGTVPAVAGMVVGTGFTAVYIIGNVYFDMPAWCFGIKATGIGTVGMLLNFAVTLSLTPLCKPPRDEIQALIADLRAPEPPDAAMAVHAE